MKSVLIGKREVGKGHPPYIIAEIGVNHNGSLELALQLIQEAAHSGAHAVKFQTFVADRIVTKEAPKALYQQKNLGDTGPQYAMLKSLETPEWWYPQLKEYCAKMNVDFISTPYDIVDVNFLASAGVDAIKVPSAWAVDLEYLSAVARCGKPVLLSTGMCTINEVAEAVHTITKYTRDLVLLHCTTDYPTAPEDCNVRTVGTLAAMFDFPVGFSDHSPSHLAASLAIALGACVIERHFTMDKAMPGPDHSSSDTPKELAALVHSVQFADLCLGHAEKRPSLCELPNMFAMRRSIVAARPIASGSVITRDDLALKRPAKGLPPRLIDSVIGCRALVDIAPEQHLDFDSIGLDPGLALHLEELTPDRIAAVDALFEGMRASLPAALTHLFSIIDTKTEPAYPLPGRGYYALAICGETVTGYAMLWGWEEDELSPSAWLYIAPEWREKGLAQRVLGMLTLEAKQRGANTIRAQVPQNDTAALRSFTAAGYTVLKTQHGIVELHAPVN